jgi:hypothetical protein
MVILRKEEKMKTRKIGKAATAVIFIGLAVVYAIMTLVAKNITDAFAQIVLLSAGSAVFGSGLTFFLIQFSQTGN